MTAPTRIASYATCSRCRLLRLCMTVDGFKLCKFCREQQEAEA